MIYSADASSDWTDEKIWHECNPALGNFRNIDEMRTLCTRAKEIPALEMTFRRLYLNQWTSSAERWMPIERWDECADGLGDIEGKVCYAGLDLSATTDLTALALVFYDGEAYDALLHYWMPEEKMREREKRDRVPYSTWVKQGFITATEGGVIDYNSIETKLSGWAEEYDIREIAFDRWGATKLSQSLIDTGFTMVPFGQGYKSMSPPTKELMSLVLSKKIRHGGNPVLRWNVDNLVVKQDEAGNLKPDKEKSTQRIDGVVALLMALDRATRHSYATSIYETQGLTVV